MPPATPTSRSMSRRCRRRSPPTGCASSAPVSNRRAGSRQSAAVCPTRRSPPLPTTPKNSQAGWRAARASSSAAASTSPSPPQVARSSTSGPNGCARSATRCCCTSCRRASPLEGWLSTLPLGLDRLRLRRAFDTEALAASFPFAAADPHADPDGILYGLAASGAPVLLDRFARENYNSVLLARSGAGKSYLAKLEALRLLFEGVQVFVIDPEDEYRRLCHAVGGAYLPLAGDNPVTLNPLDLPANGGRNALAERTLFVAELVEL